jgi:Tfp pilus assembly protein PilF
MIGNNWGYYYYKKGEYEKAVEAFQRAANHQPGNFSHWRNLGHALYMSGKTLNAEKAFSRSLALNQHQADVQKFMNAHGMKVDSGR